MNIYSLSQSFFSRLIEMAPIFLWNLLLVLLILVASGIVIRVGRFIIKGLAKRQKRLKFLSNDQRIDTIATILISVLRYGVYFIAIVTIFTNVFKVFDAKTVLAAAGIGGLAIGFGAQSLVKDIISGLFILAENQFVVGDMITVGDMTGTVEIMELRVIKIRDFNGDIHIIPNGEIKTVTNHTKADRLAIVDTKVPYQVKIDTAIESLNKACDLTNKESEFTIEPPKVLGVTEFQDTYFVIRCVAKTVTGEQWGVERMLRQNIMTCFEEENIKLGIGIKQGLVE